MLFVAHALLQGTSLAITTLLGVKHGFGFSAGLFDYVLNFGWSTKGWLIIPIGLVYFALYFFLFTFLIKRFNLKTPGREDEVDEADIKITGTPDEVALKYVEFLGGPSNIEFCDACITRLRLKLKDPSLINESGLKKLGSSGVFKMQNNVQVVVGTHAEFVAQDINKVIKNS
jgi:PTS system N-acetylglucosamine-specific IIC component